MMMMWLWSLLLFGIVAKIIWNLLDYCRTCRMMKKIPGHPGRLLVDFSIVTMDSDELRALAFSSGTGITHIFDKERISKIWVGFTPAIFFYKPEEVEIILTNHASVGKSDMYKFIYPWLGKGLVTSEGLKWKKSRKILTPAFHFRILEEFFPIINEQGMILISKLKEASATNEWVDTIQMMANCTLDVISETAMGLKIGAQEGKQREYVKALQMVEEAISIRSSVFWYNPDWVFYLSPVGKRFKKAVKILHEFSRKVIKERKSEFCKSAELTTDCSNEKVAMNSNEHPTDESLPMRKKRLAFLDLLLHYHVHDKTITEEEIREQVDTFMFAGHDTTAITISWTLYLLGLHKDIQAKVYEEQKSIFGDDKSCPVQEEDVKKMKYLECVIKETQRLYPTVPVISRRLSEDLTINGYVIPRGVSCVLWINKLHRNKEVFPNPEVFQPERFLSENSKGRHPYAFIPFSAGPRNCIGQRFAMNEARVLLSQILRNFTVHSLDQRDKLQLTADLVLTPRNKLRLKFIPR